MWDDGSVNPEPCLDKFDLVTKVPRDAGKPSGLLAMPKALQNATASCSPRSPGKGDLAPQSFTTAQIFFFLCHFRLALQQRRKPV